MPNVPGWISGTNLDDELIGTAADDKIVGQGGNDNLYGGAGNDILVGDFLDNPPRVPGVAGYDFLSGGEGDDILYGGADADTLDGAEGNDILIAGLGDDISAGGLGSDTYVYKPGDGNDIIDDENGELGATDVLDLTDLDIWNVMISRSGNDLVLGINATGETIVIKDQFLSATEQWGIERIEFANTTLDRAAFQAAADMWWDTGSYGDDVLYGTLGDNRLVGQGGNDVLYGRAGNDILVGDFLGFPSVGGQAGYDFLSGGEGDDVLYGGGDADTLDGAEGNDVLIGGLGADISAGGLGSDTYVYKRGDGNDVIDDENGEQGVTDILRLSDLYPAAVSIASSGNDLVLTISSTGETIVIKDQFLSATEQWGVERIEFANGSFIDRAAILAAVTPAGAGEAMMARHVPTNDDGGVFTGSADYVDVTNEVPSVEGSDVDIAALATGVDVVSDYLRFDGVSEISLAEIAANTNYDSGDLWFEPEPIGSFV